MRKRNFENCWIGPHVCHTNTLKYYFIVVQNARECSKQIHIKKISIFHVGFYEPTKPTHQFRSTS